MQLLMYSVLSTQINSADVSAGGLNSAYTAPVPFQRDGIYLLHKEGYYALDTSPLALLWKDPTISKYFIDTDAQGVIMPNQVPVATCHLLMNAGSSFLIFDGNCTSGRLQFSIVD